MYVKYSYFSEINDLCKILSNKYLDFFIMYRKEKIMYYKSVIHGNYICTPCF